MKLNKQDKKKVTIGLGVLVLVLIVVFAYGKVRGRNENEQREIDVSVNLTDQNGQTVTYDPNPLLIRLNKGLTTTVFFSTSERCSAIKELLLLDSVRFMATVKGYQEKYGSTLVADMRACWRVCTEGALNQENLFEQVEERINNLKDIIQ